MICEIVCKFFKQKNVGLNLTLENNFEFLTILYFYEFLLIIVLLSLFIIFYRF